MLKNNLTCLLILCTLISGCTSISSDSQPISSPEYQIDPLFREFYESDGGKALLGAGISPIFSHDRFKFQYTVAGLMVYDPQAIEIQHNSLALLGDEMVGQQEVWGEKNITPVRTQADYAVLEEFLPLYRKLGGKEKLGIPLTPPRLNPELGRYEQYYSGLGFYRMVNDKPGSVKLLAYGVWKCGDSCNQPRGGDNAVLLSEKIASVFVPWIEQIGLDYSGFALSGLYTSVEGYPTQIFENIVLVQDPAHPEKVRLLPLPQILGVYPDPIKNAAEIKGMIFIPEEGNQGYFVPQKIYDYLQLHGGIQVSGMPIGDLKFVQENVNQQCFERMCVQEDGRVGGQLRIHPAPLGYMFLQLAGKGVPGSPGLNESYPSRGQESTPELQPPNNNENPGDDLMIQVWELYPWVSSKHIQEINTSIYDGKKALANIDPILTVYLPDESPLIEHMPPTDADGQTRIDISPMNVPNGTLIPYQVCITTQDKVSHCGKGDFLVWDIP
jgi:hypothetical protein